MRTSAESCESVAGESGFVVGQADSEQAGVVAPCPLDDPVQVTGVVVPRQWDGWFGVRGLGGWGEWVGVA